MVCISFLINSFVSTETQTEESTAEANYGSITKSHLGYKCHVGNEELNWYLYFLLCTCYTIFFPQVFFFPFEAYLSVCILVTRIKVPIFTWFYIKVFIGRFFFKLLILWKIIVINFDKVCVLLDLHELSNCFIKAK